MFGLFKNPSTSETRKGKRLKIDRIWFLDKGIELTIFVLGFLIALYLDDVRADRDIKKLTDHYMEVVKSDLVKDLSSYEFAYRHDSLREMGSIYILNFLIERQNSEFRSFGTLRHNTPGRIGPGFDFGE